MPLSSGAVPLGSDAWAVPRAGLMAPQGARSCMAAPELCRLYTEGSCVCRVYGGALPTGVPQLCCTEKSRGEGCSP